MIALFIIGYLIIGLYVIHDARELVRRNRIEVRPCFGRRVVYMRCRRTGRFTGCSKNPFTLLASV